MLKRPFSFGKITLPSNILCAPLAGCSDFPFRKMSAKYGPGLMFCEMVKMDALIRRNEQTLHMLDYEPSMHPIGAQLCGSKPEIAAECAKIIEDMGFAVVDFNCGCPVDKITKDGSGSGMLKNPHLIGDIISRMVGAVKIPVTVKIRAGWDSQSIVGPLVTQIAEAAGATAICIHGRTRAQGYHGPACWDYIKECKKVAKNILVIGNGDITSPESAHKIFLETGCDALLLARGTMGNPWLPQDIYTYFSGEPLKERTPQDFKEAFLEHLEYIVAYQNEKRALMDLRRVGCWFLRNAEGARALREKLTQSTSVQQVRTLLHAFAWQD